MFRRLRLVRPALIAALFLVLSAGGLAGTAYAVEPSEMLSNPVLEARARDISSGLRCLVCQNESIDASSADFAHDVRVLVRQRLVAGDTDEQVVDYLVARYGDFILLKPPFEAKTLLLWLLPLVAVIGGVIALLVSHRRARRNPALETAPLTADEEARLQRLLSSEK